MGSAIPAFLCLWNPESPRALAFRSAVARDPGSSIESLAWADYLKGRALPELAPGTTVRIDSPGKNWEVEKALLIRGASRMSGEPWDRLSITEAGSLADDPGRIIASRQSYLGFVDCLQQFQRQVEASRKEFRWMQHPEDIAVMCDKLACQERLQHAGVRIPPVLGIVGDFEELIARMDLARQNRVFLKLCHGSSSSGAVALERSGGRMQAFSTAKMSEGREDTVLHNWRTVTRHTDLREIRRLVDAVCRHRAHAEVWSPKAGWQGRRFDVRLVVIGGKARHAVARLSQGPFTNLQLGARRASAEDLQAHLGLEAYDAMCREAERAMACFPRSLYGGVDLLLDPATHRARVLEVNAFGDLLPGIHYEGRDTYRWEIEAASQLAPS